MYFVRLLQLTRRKTRYVSGKNIKLCTYFVFFAVI